MVDVRQSNVTLVQRAQNITKAAMGCNREQVVRALEDAKRSARVAIVTLLAGVGTAEARVRLLEANGYVRAAVG